MRKARPEERAPRVRVGTAMTAAAQNSASNVCIGTAGWTVATAQAASFPAEGTSLERYAARFGCAEINSSFHRSHRPATWTRWADSVPDSFLFSCKLSKQITHVRKLVDCADLIAPALDEMRLLGDKLAVVLVQLPPSLAFDPTVAEGFFAELRKSWAGGLACEPRHPSWFEPNADTLLVAHEAARVAADPARVPAAAEPGGWGGLVYYRLHGSPVMYRSSYDDGRLGTYAAQMRPHLAKPLWCIFDNTASSAATGDALRLSELLAGD
jgi:uncharacterized protein YecE (DUF72 family)